MTSSRSLSWSHACVTDSSAIVSDSLTLYGALAAAIPSSADSGETTFTAAKETIDRDREDAEAMILIDLR